MKQVGTNLYYQEEPTEEYPVGYYWEDETSDLSRPYDTLEQAQAQLAAYVEWLTQ